MTAVRDMCILKPHVLTDAMFTSSSVYEVAPALYAGGTSYAAGVDVSVAGAQGLITVYRSLQAANLGNTPVSSPLWWKPICTLYQAYSGAATYALGERVQDNAAHLIYESLIAGNNAQPLSDVTKWLKVGATNARAAFDDEIGTATVGASPMLHVLNPGSTGGIALMDVDAGGGLVEMLDGPGGAVVYTRTLDFDASRIEDIFDWFFVPTEYLTSVVLTDLPEQYATCELRITLTASGRDPSVGIIKPGAMINIGKTKKGAKVGIVSRNKLTENQFGNLTITKRRNSKKQSLTVVTEAKRFNVIYRVLSSLDGVFCVFIATGANGYEEMAVYGLFSDFYIVIDQTTRHVCSLEIKGGI